MAKVKTRKVFNWIFIILVCGIMGIFSANIARTQLRYEDYRIPENEAQKCPEEYSQNECMLIPTYNANSSVGYEGYPFVSGQYYCQNDNNCINVKKVYFFGNVYFHYINQAVFATFYLLIFLSYLWIRKRVRRNLSKSENPVS